MPPEQRTGRVVAVCSRERLRRAELTLIYGALACSDDADCSAPMRAPDSKLHQARSLGKQCVVATHADIIASMKLRAALPHENFSSIHPLPAKAFDTKAF